MMFAQAKGRKVVDATTAETVGTVTGCVLATEPARIAALRLKPQEDVRLLAWEDIRAFGPDAVIVSPAADRTASTTAADAPDPLGKQLLTASGQQLGPLLDIEFDTTDGHLRRLIGAGVEVSGDALLGAGTYAVVIADTPPGTPPKDPAPQ
ncbi:hypothetical protein SSP35_28_00210 [Streptomyces sp. NBRC 110611]|uniref:hypothetical protein n=1 Tax=Streptomyces sp. NBRC 110611 TaxID=1621259 RepID=UPI00082B53C2|nr:hypothetical protein [Streptomyces sp. NBRC 110611]GAU71146.1 hypothetical protein SSP35_28_00210 [Streptomyces sp. NBRC 110611]